MHRLFNSSLYLIKTCLNLFLIGLVSLDSNAFKDAELYKLSIHSSTDMLRAQQFINFERYFRDLNVEGSILIFDSNHSKTYQYNAARNQTAFTPGSTFKILNSLIALEEGVIANDLSLLTWDGVKRSISSWNRDLNMREAFQISAVWFYQVLARRVGYEQMQQWVTQVGYGNQEIGSEDDLDDFWLGGELQITPQEQIKFLQRLYMNDLPFSERSIAIVKDIMIVERTPDYTIRAKTGWANQIGWYVGYLEKNENVYFFATNLDISDEINLAKRLVLTRRCLEEVASGLITTSSSPFPNSKASTLTRYAKNQQATFRLKKVERHISWLPDLYSKP